MTLAIPSEEGLSCRSNDSSFTPTKDHVLASARNFISFTPISITHAFSLRGPVKYYIASARRSEADDRMIYDPRARAQKQRRRSPFIWAKRRRERMRKNERVDR